MQSNACPNAVGGDLPKISTKLIKERKVVAVSSQEKRSCMGQVSEYRIFCLFYVLCRIAYSFGNNH